MPSKKNVAKKSKSQKKDKYYKAVDEASKIIQNLGQLRVGIKRTHPVESSVESSPEIIDSTRVSEFLD